MARRGAGGTLEVLQSYSKPVRLGEGLSYSGSLSKAAVERALSALRACARRIRRFGVRRVRGIATEACRRARDAPAFLQRVERETGLALELVTAADEARLTLTGCGPLLDPTRPRVLLFDIGGGSTEVTWVEQRAGQDPKILDVLSLPMGVVTFSERYGGDTVSRGAFRDMVATVFSELGPMEAKHTIGNELAADRVQVIGTSGTVTTLAAASLGLERYDRSRVDGLEIKLDEVAAVSADFAASAWVDRARNPCIGPDRADLVIAGCAILEAIFKRWPADRLRVADRGIREGLLLSMMAEDDVMSARSSRTS